MMVYMHHQSFVIPHHNLPLPYQADGEHYRTEKCFRLMRNGLLHYRGWGCAPRGMQMDINEFGIVPTPQWINRAYVFLIPEVRNAVLRKSKNAAMKRVGQLILRFNQLDFVDLTD